MKLSSVGSKNTMKLEVCAGPTSMPATFMFPHVTRKVRNTPPTTRTATDRSNGIMAAAATGTISESPNLERKIMSSARYPNFHSNSEMTSNTNKNRIMKSPNSGN